MKSVTSSPHVARIFRLLLDFFRVDDHNHPRPQYIFEPRLWWEIKRKCVFFGPPAAPPAAPPHEPGGGYWPSYARRYSLRSASILRQSSILIDFYHSIIDTDCVNQCPASRLVKTEEHKLRAGSSRMDNILPSDPQTMNRLDYSRHEACPRGGINEGSASVNSFFVSRSCTSCVMGSCFNMQITWASGERKYEVFSGLYT